VSPADQERTSCAEGRIIRSDHCPREESSECQAGLCTVGTDVRKLAFSFMCGSYLDAMVPGGLLGEGYTLFVIDRGDTPITTLDRPFVSRSDHPPVMTDQTSRPIPQESCLRNHQCQYDPVLFLNP
jgi:hypothetical protein